MKKTVVAVEHLVKKYNKAETNAVDDISFSVFEGEFFAFLGPNGAGKTTTISILTTILSKTSGTVTIADFDSEKEQANVRRHIGVIFQKPSLDINLTAEENIRFHTILYGMYPFRPAFSMMPDSYKKRVASLAEILDIEKEMFKPIKTFSGGMKRKLEIVRSLMHNPKILFLDEPTSGLDPVARKNLWEYLKGVRKKHKTTIFLTTHYLDEAEDADRVCVINKGKIVALGTPDELKERLIEEYLIMDSDNRLSLQKELEKYTYNFTLDETYKVMLEGRSAQEIIQSIHTKLSVLKTHTPSLEEAYVEIVKE